MAVFKQQNQEQQSYQEAKFHFINAPISSNVCYF